MQRITIEEQFLQGKAPDAALCEDAIYAGDHYLAVIDGLTAKGGSGMTGRPAGEPPRKFCVGPWRSSRRTSARRRESSR